MATVTIEPERTGGDTNLVRTSTDDSGTTVFEAGGENYAALPVDSNGNAVANVSPRTGLLGTVSPSVGLMGVVNAGESEIARATDADAEVWYPQTVGDEPSVNYRNKLIDTLTIHFPAQTLATAGVLVGFPDPDSGALRFADGKETAAYSNSAGSVATIAWTAHGLATGNGVYLRSDASQSGAILPAGTYVVTVLDADTFTVPSADATVESSTVNVWTGKFNAAHADVATFTAKGLIQIAAATGTYLRVTASTTSATALTSRGQTSSGGYSAQTQPLVSGQTTSAPIDIVNMPRMSSGADLIRLVVNHDIAAGAVVSVQSFVQYSIYAL